jgi:hypothetical protein
MKLADSVRPKTPEDTIAFIKQYVFPTLDVCDKLLDDILESLPIWPMMQTTVIPLTTFAGRRDAGRRRLEGEVRRAGG